ncbi:late embryogenesis abundant protein D-34-like [Populus nigra]|uniref:late embryogenesis abundant protein D-34-like n=1 Tax=Populus nigra TaxID=3691 RepID=UPI002B267293|nr:late embryogenesis abundant protein D-34-like [Populus nigra]
MSQRQQQRPQEPIKYGDVFSVEGELAKKPVAPRDAAMMQTAENALMGQIQRGCAASMMQSAAMRNERAGFVGHSDVNDVANYQGVSVTETEMPGRRIITEAIGGQSPPPLFQQVDAGITIGEALEATALSCGQKPVEWSDAAAIQAAEVRATGLTTITPGGVAAAAQSAATINARMTKDEDKTKLSDVLADATSKLPADKPATRKDAEGVTGAEMRNDPFLTTHPAGVAASVAAAARLNQQNNTKNKKES